MTEALNLMVDKRVPSSDTTTRPPSWEGKRVSIRPVLPNDRQRLYEWTIHPNNCVRWRFRGGIPDPTEFERSLDAGVLVQFITTRKETVEAVGLVTAYNANHRDGHVFVSALCDPRYQSSGLLIEGFALLIDYLFLNWPFRKIYLESMEFNLGQYANSLGRLLIEEGRLKDHVFYDDRYWDLVTAALYRADWSKVQLKRAAGLLPFSEGSWEKCETDLDLDDFCRLIGSQISTGRYVEPRAESLLAEDLGFDSLSMFELCDLIEQASGVDGVDWLAEVRTVRDAYKWYLTLRSMPSNNQVDAGPQ
jgi:RimJ/RimL family protein N-acetyltransferase/acyl carrier protein